MENTLCNAVVPSMTSIGCDMGYTPPATNSQAKTAINKMIEDGLPPDKIIAMQDYAKELRRKFPHMKEYRVSRKVAEYFRIKLV